MYFFYQTAPIKYDEMVFIMDDKSKSISQSIDFFYTFKIYALYLFRLSHWGHRHLLQLSQPDCIRVYNRTIANLINIPISLLESRTISWPRLLKTISVPLKLYAFIYSRRIVYTIVVS